MRQAQVVCVEPAGNQVGESPLWHAGEGALYWVDAYAGAILRLGPDGAVSRWPLEGRIGSIVLHDGGGFVAAMEGGFCRIDLGAAGALPAVRRIVDPTPARPGTLLNDGKCDRRGRYWCGSRNLEFNAPTGALYRLDASLQCREMDAGFIVSNGMAWSPDDRTMYFADSRQSTVFAYDFDVDDGAIRNRRVFADTRAFGGRPDGATVDADGGYWCALVHGGAVARFTPDGRLDRRIEMPVRHPTMCMFGGPGLDVLYVTSATAMLSGGELAAQPLAGALFAVHGLGVRGLAEPRFHG